MCRPRGRRDPRAPAGAARPPARRRHRGAGRDAHPRPGGAAARLAGRAVGRHVPARRAGDRACRQPFAADRRRADHRPRCHDAGRRARPAAGAGAGAADGDAADHPRPRPGPPGLRQRIVVLHAGQVVEDAPAAALFAAPRHPYTAAPARGEPGARGDARRSARHRRRGARSARRPAGLPLLRPLRPRRGTRAGPGRSPPSPRRRATASPAPGRYDAAAAISRASRKRFPLPGGRRLHALDGVDLLLPEGGSLGIVGESGSGKTTLARIVARLAAPSEGRVLFAGRDLAAVPLRRFGRDPARAAIRMVFQDAGEALNPAYSAAPAASRWGSAGCARRARCWRACAAIGPGRRPRRGAARPPSASALRRAAHARRYRPRADQPAAPAGARRADRLARRVGAGDGAAPARRGAAHAGHGLPVRVTRPERGAADVPGGHGALSRPRRRDRPGRGSAARGRCIPTRARWSPRSPAARAPVPPAAEHAEPDRPRRRRLPVPQPLRPGDRALPARAAGAARRGAGPAAWPATPLNAPAAC